MTELIFSMTLYSRFRVGASSGRDGRDLAIDHHEPVHGDHLKGLMLEQARFLASNGHLPGVRLIEDVFGTPSKPSPWTWTSATPSPPFVWDFTDRHRVHIDRDDHAAVKDMVVRAEAAWTQKANFSVIWCGPAGCDDVGRQLALLAVAGASVHHMGAWRRRGLGWVGIRAEGRDLTTDLVTLKASAA